MPSFFSDLVPGSGTYLSQETLYQSESCKRRLVQHVAKVSCIPPWPAGSPSSCPLHLLYLLNLKFVTGIPNRSCILKLGVNQCSVCNFLSMPRCQGQIAPKTHCLSCLTRNFRNMLTPIQIVCDSYSKIFGGLNLVQSLLM